MRPFIEAAGVLGSDDEPAWKETLGALERDTEHVKAPQLLLSRDNMRDG
jgi:hypothetical protein